VLWQATRLSDDQPQEDHIYVLLVQVILGLARLDMCPFYQIVDAIYVMDAAMCPDPDLAPSICFRRARQRKTKATACNTAR